MMLRNNNSMSIRIYLSFFCIILQSCFLNLFSGQGWLGCFLLIVLNLKNIQSTLKCIYRTKILYFFICFVMIMLLKGLDIQWICYMLFVFVATICFLLNYRDGKSSFLEDFYKFLKLLFYYSLLHVVVLMFFKSSLRPATLISGIQPYTFNYLCFFNQYSSGELRIQGLAWEPGVWQIFLNAFLLFSIIKQKGIKVILLVSLCIYFTHSTNGYIVMLLNWAVYLYKSPYKKRIIPIAVMLAIFSIPLLWSNIENKLVGENQVSGLARIRDVQVGKLLLLKYPLIGTSTATINSDPEVVHLKQMLFYNQLGRDANELNYQGFEEDGFLNGLLMVFLDWGIILGGLIIVLFCRSPLLEKKKSMLIYSCMFFLSLFGEPISRTILFYIFPISTIMFREHILFRNDNSK